jgi:hypothetical protein
MANARVFEELKATLMNATPSQLNSHSIFVYFAFLKKSE